MPLSNCATSAGCSNPRSSVSTASGTTVRKPLAMAWTCSSIPPCVRHSVNALTNSSLLSSVTCNSPSAPSKATSEVPTCNKTLPGKDLSVPGSLSLSRTTAGSDSTAPKGTAATSAAVATDDDDEAASVSGSGCAADEEQVEDEDDDEAEEPVASTDLLPEATERSCDGLGGCSSVLPSGSVKGMSKPSSATGLANNHFTFVR
mmetsp:Transcript_11562/g.41245  ORF Transcript_11562/g.41245 Transcript_11562/m.41245 type:complete len:203 (-) Transcript_11562:637-1245(-)